MQQMFEIQERKTSADVVFDYLYEQIGSLNLLPGTKISETEIATQFGISRQPVRDAFSRLSNLGLLLIRPQKATVVKKFSLDGIATARFVRLSVELEVMRKAATLWDGSLSSAFEENMRLQEKAYADEDIDKFHELDYEFHKLLSHLGNSDFAFDIIAQNKAQVDRLCVLSLTAKHGMRQLIDDHKLSLSQLSENDVNGVCDTIRLHLSRLDDTITAIHKSHASYFEN
jgi:DNA-binding GntR family transcriptional regulator